MPALPGGSRRSLAAEAATLRETLDGEGLSAEESVRLRNRIDQTLGRRRGARWLGYGALAAGAGTILGVIFAVSEPAGLDEPAAGAWYQATENAECIEALDASRIAVGSCPGGAVVEVGKSRVALEPNTVLAYRAGHPTQRHTLEPRTNADRTNDDGTTVVLRRGAAEFDVEPISDRRRSFRVQVSGGTIVVLGTKFRAVERGRAGEVRLFHGHIEFQPNQGAPIELRPGERLSWPVHPAKLTVKERAVDDPALSPSTSQRAPEDDPTEEGSEAETTRGAAQGNGEVARGNGEAEQSRVEKLGIDRVMQRLFQLRSQRRYRDAAALLESNLDRRDFTRAQQRRLSFELALLLDDQLRDHRAACRQYRAHARAFPRDLVRRAELERRLARCR